MAYCHGSSIPELSARREPSAETALPHPRHHTGAGLDEIWQPINEHHKLLSSSGELEERRRRQLLGWMWSLVDEGLRAAVREHAQVADTLTALEEDVLEGRTTPTAAAEKIFAAFKG